MLKAISIVLEFSDIFLDPTVAEKIFQGFILVPSKYEFDDEYKSSSLEMIFDTIKDIIRARNKGKLTMGRRRKEFTTLSQMGFVPISIKALEYHLDNNTIDEVHSSSIKVYNQARNTVTLDLISSKGTLIT